MWWDVFCEMVKLYCRSELDPALQTLDWPAFHARQNVSQLSSLPPFHVSETCPAGLVIF